VIVRDTPVTPVAVIGMGCRLPGGIDSPELLWDAVLRGDDLITEVPPDRWDVDEYYDPEPGVPGRSVSRWGGFLDDVTGFDAPFFGFGDREAAAMDPQHRLLLETSWEAIENAGLAPASLANSATGVFMGLSHDDYELVTYDAGALHDPYGYPGTTFSMASGRIAYWLGVHGPALTVDSACSTGLLTVHLACRSLHEGESDLALAGGCTVMFSPEVSASGSALGMYSPRGRCRSFDVGADGFVRGEASAVVLLKRLPDALRDGDRILAVVRGTAANQDGRTKTISRPSLQAQTEVYRSALTVAGVDPTTVGMVEAHGTGTPVGDPIEFGSLSAVYGRDGQPCALGSAKSNFGHTECAAGTVGLIKTVLALQRGLVPPMVHFTRLPDTLAEIDTGLFVPAATTSWPSRPGQTMRRAAVSSYGVTGTNAHAVLEQAPQSEGPADLHAPAGPQLFALSATSADALRQTSRRLAEWVTARTDQVVPSDLAYTLARRRAHRPVRTVAVAEGLTDLAEQLRGIAEGVTAYLPAVGQDDRGPVWVFSGQGSQWAAMGTELLATEPVFAASVAEAEPLILAESGFSVTEAMSAPQTVTGIDRIQPVLFTMQVALANTMRSYGVQPGAVVGHSMGEVAAAVVAEALSLQDGVRVICRRSRLMCRVAGAGAMASVELPAAKVREELAAAGVTDVVVSVISSPRATVIGGDPQMVQELVAAWERRDIMAREVAVDVASHSPQVDPILADLANELAELTPMTPTVPYYAATLDDPRTPPAFDAGYWVDNLRQPVRFAAAVQAALEDGHRVFGEPSPHPLLTRAVEQTARAADIPVQALACMRREQPLPHGLLEFVGDLHCAGASVDFSALYPSGRLVDAPLPTWTHRQLFIGSTDQSRATGGARTIVIHPLLGAHVRLPEEPERHVWQGDVGTAELPWLADHRVHSVPALPAAAFCEMALSAAYAVFGDNCEVRDINFEQMLLLDEVTPMTTIASRDTSGAVNLAMQTEHEGEQTRRATAVLHAVDERQPARLDLAAVRAAHPSRVDGAELRQWFDERGVQFGPAFGGLTAVHTSSGNARSLLAEVKLPSAVRAQRTFFQVHPALLDACFQSVAAHPSMLESGNRGLLLPLGVDRLRCYGPAHEVRYCVTRVRPGEGAEAEGDLDLLDESGAVVLSVRGLRMGAGSPDGIEPERLPAERLLTIAWQQNEPPALQDPDPGRWLLVDTSDTSDTSDALPAGLVDVLKSLGAQCDWLKWPQDANHLACVQQLTDLLGTGAIKGLIVLFPPPVGPPDEAGVVRAREHVRHLLRIARELPEMPGEPSRLYVLTRAAAPVVPADQTNLDQTGLRGLVRVIGTEHPQLHPTQIDVDAGCDAEKLATELLSGSDEDETAWRGGQWYNARLRPSPLRPEDRRTTSVQHDRDGMRLEIRNPGDLESLELTAIDRTPPGPGQIEIAVSASSINFADVLAALGRYPDIDGRRPQLGVDVAGAVTRVGPDVTEHWVGDRVGGFSGYANGCWGTFVTCDARLVAAAPADLTPGQAAAMATAYGTAWYGLNDLAGIEAGDRVLIHSGTGGVGTAAIAVARRAGAEIFATAGAPARRKILHDMGIEHVYDSRSTAFAEEIRRDTDGYGVDIVLNSLTGASQRAGLELLAHGGRFVEIGKRDIYGDTRMGLYPFRRNLTFFGVDLALMCQTNPRRINKLLRKVYELVETGELPPLDTTEYPLAEATNAIRVMGAAEHTGKLTLEVPGTGSSRVVVPPERAHVFRRDGAYVVTGGLGGLGLFLAAEMAKGGCGRIVLTGRSSPTAKAQQAIDAIRGYGADVDVVCGNIADADTAARVVAAATATGLPLRGVLHAAAVVEDATLTNITDELIDRDWAPKVYGAWHLHLATIAHPLDWFCSFSSAAALLGSPGQGAYAAANSWLDGFTRWRRAQGLPATVIAWGAWAEIGRAAFLEEGGTTMIGPEEGAHAFETLLRYDRTYTGYTPTTGASWLAALIARVPFAEALRGTTEQTVSEGATLREELRSLAVDEWPTRLRRLVAEQAGLILRRSIDLDRSFFDHGLDSLSNLELRTRIETEAGVRLSPKTIATHNTVRDLAKHLSDTLSAELKV
jgi:acyl transferase domain-containing protein/acyl carrier protein